MKRAFTLAEVVVVMGMLTLLYALLLAVVVQVGNVSRRVTIAASHQVELVKTTEQFRWQLRCLFSQTDPQPAVTNATTNGAVNATQTTANATTNTTANTSNSTPTSAQTAGMIGQPGSGVYGQRAAEGRDVILFITTHPTGQVGVCEVGYKLDENKAGVSDLLYRQFPTRSVGGFHAVVDQQEGPWKVLLKDVKQFSLDYSVDGITWQREWDETDAPRRVRLHLETAAGDVIDTQISPGIGAGRW